jgi:hypothetical protein
MALRDWYAWQIGVMWAIGIGLLWTLGRVSATIIDARSRTGIGGTPGASAPLWMTGVILLVVMVLLVVTIRWARARFLDE